MADKELMSFSLNTSDWYSKKELIENIQNLRSDKLVITVEDKAIKISEYQPEIEVLPEEKPEEDSQERRIIDVPTGGLKIAFTRLFRDKGLCVSDKDAHYYFSFDRKWVTPTRAKDLIFTALERKVIKKENDTYSPNFDLATMPENLDISYDFLKEKATQVQPSQPQPEPIKHDEKKVKPKFSWAKIRGNNDRCRKCSNLSKKCDECFRWSHHSDNPNIPS